MIMKPFGEDVLEEQEVYDIAAITCWSPRSASVQIPPRRLQRTMSHPRPGIFNSNFVGYSVHVTQPGMQGWPEAVEEEKLEFEKLNEVVPVMKVVVGFDVPCDFCKFK
ncbi:hypothetical protein N7G274_008053 [Stereocaulon virgatum]|uniref:Uncharacterized protein n=1 Tax=Stereocaulon virgatum TaxID=373712 RepID=A0ABR4A1S9_9LECA